MDCHSLLRKGEYLAWETNSWPVIHITWAKLAETTDFISHVFILSSQNVHVSDQGIGAGGEVLFLGGGIFLLIKSEP